MKIQHIWILIFLINHTNGLSVDISPNPVAVSIGDDLVVTSTITKTVSESWKVFIFYVNENEKSSACRGASYNPSAQCNDIFGCSLGLGFNCNYTHFNLLIYNVSAALIGSTIYAEVSFDTSSKVKSNTTIIKLKVPLNGISLFPTGTITMEEMKTQIFQCSATSLPIPSLSWLLRGSTLLTQSLSLTSANTVTSNYRYIARKNDNGERILCIAVYESTSFSASALLNILYAPTVTILPNYNAYNVIENTTNFQLNCSVSSANPAVHSYRWYKDGSLISTTLTYTLTTVQRSNNGNYTCDATNSVNSSERSSAILINVLYGIELYPISMKKYQEGKQLSITCNGRSEPAITDNDVKWTKENNSTFNRKGKQLIIKNVNRLDHGYYICSVVIELSPTVGVPIRVIGITSVEVDIIYIPIVSTSPRVNPYNVIENTTNVNMSCNVTDSNPPATSFRWFKETSMIATTATYTIDRINRSHSGRYTCAATNAAGISSQSLLSKLTLNVLYGVIVSPISKQQPIEGATLVVLCKGQSNPTLTDDDITWTKQNNNTFQQTGKQLVINNVNRLDSGNYICNAVVTLLPSIGPAAVFIGTTIAQVDVIYRPSVAVAPYYNPFNMIENKTNVQLRCTVTEAKPSVTSFRWYKDGSVISTTATYTIPIIKQSNSGRYTCDATNDVGSSGLSIALSLNVLYGVKVVSISKQAAAEGNELNITCDAQSNPTYTDNDVSWTKKHNSTFKQFGKHLFISKINRFDIGTFTCIVTLTLTPSIGKSVDVHGTTNVEIDVLFKPMMDESKKSTDKLIGVSKNLETYITIHLIANPVPLLQWIFIHGIVMNICCNNTIDSNNTFNGKNISSSILIPGKIGKYVIITENSVGVFSHVFTVVLEGKPKSPSIVCVLCKSTLATVVWLHDFNGGQLQSFRVVYWDNERKFGTEMSDEIAENETYRANTYTVNDLKPHTKYTFYVVSNNNFGNSRSKVIECSTDELSIRSEATQFSKVLESGIAMLSIGLFAVFSSLVFAVYHYLRKKKLASTSSSHAYTGIRASNRALSSNYDAVEECSDEKKLSQEQTDTSFNTYEECGAYSNTTLHIDSYVIPGSTSSNKKGGAYDKSSDKKKADTDYDDI